MSNNEIEKLLVNNNELVWVNKFTFDNRIDIFCTD